MTQTATRDQATARLLDYYQHTAALADALLAPRPAPRPRPARYQPRFPAWPTASRPWPGARADRASLLACLDQATGAGQHARIIALTAGLAVLLCHGGP